MNDGMTYRERFEATLAHRTVDRPPMDLDSTDMTGIEGGPRSLAPLLGLPSGGDPAALDEAVLVALDTDIRGVGGLLRPESPLAGRVSDTEYTDCWGLRYRWNGHHYEMVEPPLAGATLADIERYPWPDPDRLAPGTIQAIRERARFLREETPYVVCGRHPYYGVFELGCWLFGFDDFLYRLAGEPEFVQRFFEMVWNYQKKMDEIYYGAIGRYLHFTTSGDDFGTQAGPFMSPVMFAESVAPFLKRRIAHIREFTEARFFHHTCGSVHALIPTLIECGVEILNPIQPGVPGMEPWRLKRDFGDRLTFYGGVDTQHLLPRGTPEEVAASVRELVSVLGRDGGYVLSAAHHIQEDVPPANAVALYRAVRTGSAPLTAVINPKETAMTSKEIVNRAIAGRNPPRVPVIYCNRDHEFSDVLETGWAARTGFVPEPRGLTEWGYVWETLDGTMGQPHGYPLADDAAFPGYRPPDPRAPGRLDHVPAWCRKHADKFLVLGLGITGFNQATFLRGFEDFLADMAGDPARVGCLLDWVFDFENGLIEQAEPLAVDAIKFGDDWGTQQGLIISPALWREVFKPRYADQFARVHRSGRKVWFHSCGNIEAIIGDLIEIGVDVLELLQPDVFGVERLGAAYGGKVCFCCSVDHQRRAISGTREEIHAYARLLADQLGAHGGRFIGYIEDYASLGMGEDQYQWIRQAFHGLGG